MEKMNVNEVENKVVEGEVLCQFMDKQCSNCQYWDSSYSGGYCEVHKRVQGSYGWCKNWKYSG